VIQACEHRRHPFVAAVVANGPTTPTIDAARLTIARASIGISAFTD